MRFYTSYTNRRHNSYGAGILPGDPVHTRGWNAGVKVTARGSKISADHFDVYMTGGSREATSSVHVGTVSDTPDGPRWTPAEKPGRIPAHAGGKPVISAIPAQSHENSPAPDVYFCVVLAGRWPSGEPYFGTAQMHRDESGSWSVTEQSDYWDHHMSQTEAVSEIIRAAGHERPAVTAR